MRAKAEKGQAQRIGPVHSSRIESYYYVLLCILHVAQLRPVFNVISSPRKRSLFISRVPLPFSLLLFMHERNLLSYDFHPSSFDFSSKFEIIYFLNYYY